MATVWFSAVRRRGYQFSGLSNDRKRADNVYRIRDRDLLNFWDISKTGRESG